MGGAVGAMVPAPVGEALAPDDEEAPPDGEADPVGDGEAWIEARAASEGPFELGVGVVVLHATSASEIRTASGPRCRATPIATPSIYADLGIRQWDDRVVAQQSSVRVGRTPERAYTWHYPGGQAGL